MSVLRLYSGDGAEPTPGRSGGALSASMSLSQFYEAYVRPVCLVDRDAGTLKEYRTTIKYWKEATGDPGLRKIDDYTIAKFREWLQAFRWRGQPLSDQTRRKHLVNLQFVIDRAGPRKDRETPAAELLTSTPAVPKPAQRFDDVTDNFTLEEIAYFLEACDVAQQPTLKGVSAPTFWRVLWLFGYNVGLRIETLTLLRWRWMETDDLGSWLAIPPAAMKRDRGFRCYVSPVALAALEHLRPLQSELIFPWGMSENWLHNCRRRIMQASRISTARRSIGFHGLRKALATELGIINPLAAEIQLDHKTRNVTRNHYTHKKVVVEAMKHLPQPPWDGFDSRQRRLF